MRSKYKELTLANVIFAMGKPVLDLPRKIINRVVNRAQTDVGAHQRERRNELLSAQRALPPSTPTLEAKNKSDSNSFKGIQTLAVTDSSRSKPTEINSARTTRQKFGLANAVFEAGTFALGILYKKTKIHARQDAINNILSLIVIHHKNENNGGIVAGSNPLVLHKIASTPSTSLGFLTPKKEHGSNSVFSTPKANTLLVSPNIPSLSPSTTDRIGTPILDSSTPEGVGTPDLSSSSLEGVGTPSLGSSSPEGVGTPTLDSSTPEGVGTPDLSSSSLEGVGTPNLCSPNYEKEEEPDLKFPNSAEGNTKSSNFSEVEELGSPIQRPKKGKPRGAKIKNPRRLFDDLVETSSGSDDKENKVKIIPNIVIKYSTETPEGKVNMAVKLPPKAVTKLFQSIGDDGRRKKVNMEEVQSSGQSGSPLASVDMNKLK